MDLSRSPLLSAQSHTVPVSDTASDLPEMHAPGSFHWAGPSQTRRFRAREREAGEREDFREDCPVPPLATERYGPGPPRPAEAGAGTVLSGRRCSGVRGAQVPGGWGLALSPWASGSYNDDKMHPSSVSVAGLQLTPARTTAPAQCQPRGLPPNTQDTHSYLLSRQSTEATSTISLLDAARTGLALARAIGPQAPRRLVS